MAAPPQEKQLPLVLKKMEQLLPPKYMYLVNDCFETYAKEVEKNDLEDVDTDSILSRYALAIMDQLANPYVFPPFHKRIREPVDFYFQGNEFIAPLVDVGASVVAGENNIPKMMAQLAAGDNVVLLANHQSEADPYVLSILLDQKYPGFVEEMVSVAGDRVTTDPLAASFSKGRNLLCIYSKKHLEIPPELKSMKQSHNRKVMKDMARMFQAGSTCIWVAPSGGRDRPDPDGNFQVAKFDPKSVEMFRLMASKAKGKTTHFYPLSMYTWPVAPPPRDMVAGALGEKRVLKRSGTGLFFGDEIDMDDLPQGCVVDGFPEGCVPEDREGKRDFLAQYIHGQVNDNYQQLLNDGSFNNLMD